MGNTFIEEGPIFTEVIRSDNVKKLKNFMKIYKIKQNQEISKGRTALFLCCLFGSNKCLQYLIEIGDDVNLPESMNENNTPLICACKYNNIKTAEILIENKCNLLIENSYGMTAFDYSIVMGNYNISLMFMEKHNFKLEKSVDDYIRLNNLVDGPRFKMELFIDNLKNQVPVGKTPSFENDRKKRLLYNSGKVPDPNESWADFFKRVKEFNISNPPMVDPDTVDKTKLNGIFMKMQSKLVEYEHGVESIFLFKF